MASAQIAVMFPGQGSQVVGMGKEFFETRQAAREFVDQAEKIVDIPLKKLCFEGPLEQLTLAANLQPAITMVNMLCLEAAVEAGLKADYFIGHSLGEYSALYAAGILAREETMRLVAARGKIMGKEGELHPGGMRAVLGLTLEEVQKILTQVNQSDQLSIGNHNSELQVVLSGSNSALDAAEELALAAQAKVVPLKVSIANHSPLMAGALTDFQTAMDTVVFKKPHTPVFFNVTADREDSPENIHDIMVRQIVSTVRWHETIHRLYQAGVRHFIEVGPNKVLTGLMKRILPKGSEFQTHRIDSPISLEKTLSQI